MTDTYARDVQAREGFVRRGRPRPRDTVDRDEQVYQLLRTGGPAGRADLAAALQTGENQVYNALARLRAAGRVRRAPGKTDGAQGKTWEVVE